MCSHNSSADDAIGEQITWRERGTEAGERGDIRLRFCPRSDRFWSDFCEEEHARTSGIITHCYQEENEIFSAVQIAVFWLLTPIQSFYRDDANFHCDTPMDTESQNPIEWAADIQPEQVQLAFTALVARSTSKPGPNVTRVSLDVSQATQSYGMLEKTALIMFTAEEAPSRDRVVSWLQEAISTARQMRISAVRELSRKHFLLLMESQEQKEAILLNPPTRMYGKAIRISKWSPSYNFAEAAKASKQIWLELQNVDPLLIGQGEIMLQSLGQVLYHTVLKTSDLRYAHMRACIIRDSINDVPESVILDLPWEGHVVQEVVYTLMPVSCCRTF
ncbi:hypothetical protein R1sor_021838 [Riccia sorocarpa]|uniref:Uncharacterized protein n=1 Tax=Riccia sorocarpa TaxID=122646 RepID=A0ABD3GK32_9MARC